MKKTATRTPVVPVTTKDLPVSVTANTTDEWLQKAMVNMKRMHQDEAYRLEVAKKLS